MENTQTGRRSTDSIKLELNMDEETEEIEIQKRRRKSPPVEGKHLNVQRRPSRTGGSHYSKRDALSLAKVWIIVSECRIQLE